MKAVIAQKPWLKDPLVVRKKWDEDEYQLVEHGGKKKMYFGICKMMEMLFHPPIIRGLEIARGAFITAGHNGESAVVTLHCFADQVRCSGRETVETFRIVYCGCNIFSEATRIVAT
jgi:hypothetical protein